MLSEFNTFFKKKNHGLILICNQKIDVSVNLFYGLLYRKMNLMYYNTVE